MRRLLLPLGLALIAAAALLLLVWLFQRRLIYFPEPLSGVTPADLGLAFRDVRRVTADGGEIRGWYVEPAVPDPSGAVVLFTHGNGGNVEHRLAHARVLAGAGIPVLLFDYRGYGDSPGTPTEEGCYLDAEAAHDWLVEEAGVDPSRITAWGESLGGAVAVELALRRPLSGLVLESTFSSLAAIGGRHYPWLPVRWLLRDRFDSLAKAPSTSLPLLQFHGDRDQIVPIELGRELHAAFPAPREFVVLHLAHNDGGPLVAGGEGRERALAFLRAGSLPPEGLGSAAGGRAGDGDGDDAR